LRQYLYFDASKGSKLSTERTTSVIVYYESMKRKLKIKPIIDEAKAKDKTYNECLEN
jgi:hypothetical protein